MTTRKPKLRFLSALLAMAMMLTLLPTAAFAEDKFTDGDWEYIIDNGTATIIKYNGTATDITLPEMVNGIIVTSIAGYNNHSVFKKGNEITSITIPDSVVTFGDVAFADCSNLKNFIIPDGITYIGNGVFHNCISLESITIPNTVKEIGRSSFDSCTGLKTVTILDGLTKIGGASFYDCTNLTTITIPSSVTFIEQIAFSGCSALQKVEFGGTESQWKNAVGTANLQLPDSASVEYLSGQITYYAPERTVCYTETTLKGQKISAPESTPTKEGYTLDGWYRNPECTQKFDFNTETFDVDELSLYSKWTINKYHVNFVTAHDIAPDTMVVEHGATIDTDTTLKSEGYIFDGWYYTEDGAEKKFVFGETKVTNDITLTAKWNRIKYDVNFVVDGETEKMQEVEHGEVIKAPELTKTGYTFDGWYKDEACEGEKFDFTTTIKENIILYARWMLNSYTVKFVDGEDEVLKVTIDYNTTLTSDKAPETPAKEGYTFDGWYNDDEKFVFSETKVTSDTTLTAKWTINKYTVTFDTNGRGTAPDAETADYNTTVKQPADPTAESYDFGGWYIEKECTNAFDFDTAITKDITLYAKWTEVKKPAPTPGEDKPTTPEEPVKPGDDKPTTPENPEQPSTPDAPSAPETPSNPETPNEPETPTEPSTPNAPDTPEQPSQPENPSTPNEPEKPSDPDAPTKPSAPNVPETPDKPSDPEEKPSTDNPTEEPQQPAKNDSGTGALIVGGVLVAGGVATGVLVYKLAVEYIQAGLPEGAAIPETREQLAVALWQKAGQPEVAVEEGITLTDTEKAMRWAVENQLVSAEGEDSVSKIDVLLAVYKASKL